MYGVTPPWHEFLLLLAAALLAAVLAALLPLRWPSPRRRGGPPQPPGGTSPKPSALDGTGSAPPLPLGEVVLPAAAGRTGEGRSPSPLRREPALSEEKGQGAGRLWDAAYAAAFALALLQLVSQAILRHQSFHSQALDLGSLAQVAWNTSQGRWFESSVIPTTTNLLAEHFAPVFLVIAPLYRLLPDPRLLLLLQSAGLALASLPLYLLARESLGRPLGLALAVVFLLSSPLLYLNLADFHEIALAVPLLSAALYFLARGRWALVALALGGTLLLREEMGFVAAAFGLWLLAPHPLAPPPEADGEGVAKSGVRRLWGGAITLAGLAWALGAILVVIPAVRGGSSYPYLDRYAYLGPDVPSMLATMLLRPLDVLAVVATPERADWLVRQLLPWGLLPLLGPPLLLGLPTLAYTLLSQDPAQYDIQSQYHAPLIPIVAFGALAAMERLGGLRTAGPHPDPLPEGEGPPPNLSPWERSSAAGGRVRARRALAAFLLAAAGLSYVLHGPGVLARGFDADQYGSTERTRLTEEILGRIPPDAGVATQTNLVPHLVNRPHLSLLPWVRDWPAVDYVLLDRQGNRYPLGDDEYERLEGELTSRLGFERLVEMEDLVLYRRR